MKHFKRIIASLLVCVLAFSLAACAQTSQNTSTPAPAAAATAAPTAAPTEEPKIDFPTETITIVVPFAAGGNVDLTCRIIAEEMGKVLGTNVVVENKEGGGAIIGQTYALSQEPDGYTMLALTSSFVTNILSGDTEFKMEDAVAIGQFCFDPELVVVSADSGITTIEEFMEQAKAATLTNSTPGFSTSHHIASLILANTYGLHFDYMHTNGSAEQTVQLAGGHAQCGMTTYGGAATLIDEGKIVPLAICDAQRSTTLPDVPTMAEAGYDFTYGAYRGFAVPAGTPDEVVQILSDALKTVMSSDTVIQAFNDAGFPISYLSAADYQTMLDNDYANMEAIYYLIQE